MANYSVLGCEKLKAAIFSQAIVERRFHGMGKCPSNWSQTGVRFTDVKVCVEIATFRHLGFDVSHLDVNRFVNEGVEIAVDYFYGNYMDTDNTSAALMRKSKDNKDLCWLEVYRNGLLLAYLSDDIIARQKLTEWVEPWLPFDETSYLLTQDDNYYHKLLAEFINTGEIITGILEDKIKGSRRKRPQLLLSCLNGIRKQEEGTFSCALKKFLDYYLTSEFGKSGISTYFSIEASILWHVAQRHGMSPTSLREEEAALIMTRQSLGFAD